MVKRALEIAGIDSTRFPPERIGSAISKAKNQLLPPDKYAATGSDFFTNTVAAVYAIYQKKMREANGLDFDDLLYVPALALKLDEELRAELDARFKFVLIDEYQDTNRRSIRDCQAAVGRFPQLVRGRRPGSIDLQMAWLRHQEHPRFRARLPGRPRHHARQKLSLDAGDSSGG